MASVSTYLNFPHQTEEAFLFYRSVFGTEFNGPIRRFGEMPPQPGMPPMPPELAGLVMHVELPITAGHILMGTDAHEAMGFSVNMGNNVHISLHTDTRTETRRLFEALSPGGKVTMELQEMFWGAYFGSCTDRFGVHWMFNCSEKS